MQKHEFFDLQLHTDEELSAIYGSRVMQRTTLHEWPLSCVQLVVREDGSRSIYKSQSGPTLEGKALQTLSGDILPTARVLHAADGYLIMDIEYIDSPLAESVHMSPDEAVLHGRALVRQIRALTCADSCPVWLDIGAVDRWVTVARQVFAAYRKVLGKGLLSPEQGERIDSMEKWSQSTDVLQAISRGNGFVHGDLAAKNVFVRPGGYKVIDWQRPLRAPAEIDLALFLDSKRVNPLRAVAPHYIGIMCLPGMWWGLGGFCAGNKYEEWRDGAIIQAHTALLEPERKYAEYA